MSKLTTILGVNLALLSLYSITLYFSFDKYGEEGIGFLIYLAGLIGIQVYC
jgi:hypothetical protein